MKQVKVTSHYEEDGVVLLKLDGTYIWPLVVGVNRLGLILFMSAAGLTKLHDTQDLMGVSVTIKEGPWPVLVLDRPPPPSYSIAAVAGLLWELRLK